MRNTIVVDIARFAAGDDYNPETIRSWILAYRRFNEAVSMLGETEKTYFLEYLRNKSVPDERFGFRLKYQILLINRAIYIVTTYMASFGFDPAIEPIRNTPDEANTSVDIEDYPIENPDICEEDDISDLYKPYNSKARMCSVSPEVLYEIEHPQMKCTSSEEVSDNKLYALVKQACIKQDVPEELTPWISMSAISYIRTGTCQPMLLIGNAGTGKTYFAKVLAEVLGLGFYKISGPGASAGRGLTGDAASFRSPRFGEIANAIAKTHSSNPVILIDEIDKCNNANKYHCLSDELLSCLDSSRTIHDNFLESNIDTSHIAFVLTANCEDLIPEWLIDRCPLIRFPDPDKNRICSILEKHINSLRTESMYKNKLAIDRTALTSCVIKIRNTGVVSLRQYIRVLDNACLEAFREMFEKKEPKKRVIVTNRHFEKAMSDIISSNSKKSVGYHIGFTA